MRFLLKISLLFLLTVTLHTTTVQTRAAKPAGERTDNSLCFISPDQGYANAVRNYCRRLIMISREFMEPSFDKTSYGNPSGRLPRGYLKYKPEGPLQNDFSYALAPAAVSRSAGYYLYGLRKILI